MRRRSGWGERVHVGVGGDAAIGVAIDAVGGGFTMRYTTTAVTAATGT